MSRISRPEVIVIVPVYPNYFHHTYGDTDAPYLERSLSLYQSESKPNKLSISRTDLYSRCCQRSIHKGIVLGLKFPNGTRLYQPDALPQNCIGKSLELVIDHQHDSTETLVNVLNERRRLNITNQVLQRANIGLTRDLAFSSDHIEGSTIRWKDSQQLNVNIHREAQNQTEEVREFVNHCKTIKEILLPIAKKSIITINEEFMHSLHRSLAVTDCVRDNQLGIYRTDERTVNHRFLSEDEEYFSPPDEVPRRTKKMFEELYELHENGVEGIFLATWLHQRFIQIHPYTDGNGRTGRLLLNAVLLIYGFPLSSVQPDIRRIYYDGLHYAFTLEKDGHDENSETPPLALLYRIVAESVLRSLDIVEGIQQVEHNT